MTPHTFYKSFEVPYPQQQVWDYLNCMKTFIDGQIWPYKVEFEDPKGGAPSFNEGMHNNHFGPFLNFAGVLGKIEEPTYRDLNYNYGAYFLGFRFIRPTRLQFWFEETETGTIVKLQVDSLARKGFGYFWSLTQRVFWASFPIVVSKGLK